MPAEWFRLGALDLPRGVIVIEATAEAAPFWPGPILSVLEELATRFPADAQPDVCFLGSDQTHSLNAVLRGLGSEIVPPGPAVCITDQMGRYPVVGPFLWKFAADPARPLLLIATGPVLDLEDWCVPEIVRRTLLYRLTGERSIAPGFRELDTTADLSALAEHLADPAVSVRIGGGPTLAIDWDNDAYGWADGAIEARSETNWAATAAFLRADGVPPTAVVTRASGVVVRLPLTPAPEPSPPAATSFSAAEANVLGLWRRGNAYYCMGCLRPHAPGQVSCLPPAALPLFPCMAGLPPGSLCRVVFHASRGWSCRLVPRGFVERSDGPVLFWRSGNWALLVSHETQWQVAAEPLSLFPEVGEGEYLLRT